MIRLDIEYSQRRSMALDLEIIFKTLPVLLAQVKDTQDTQKKKRSPSHFASKRNAFRKAFFPHGWQIIEPD